MDAMRMNLQAVHEHPGVRALLCLVYVSFGAAVAMPAELLTGFRPSTIRTEYGVTSQVEFSSGLIELEAGVLAHHLPQTMKEFWFAEPVWVIATRPTSWIRAATARVRIICAIPSLATSEWTSGRIPN